MWNGVLALQSEVALHLLFTHAKGLNILRYWPLIRKIRGMTVCTGLSQQRRVPESNISICCLSVFFLK